MDLTFCKRKKANKKHEYNFRKLKKREKHILFCEIKKAQKTRIKFFASLEKLKNMNLIFKEHGFNFLQP